MLKQASVSDLITDRISREKGYVVVTMRRYPRFVNRLLRDEYLNCMSPEPKLFEDWLTAKRKHQDHDGAFDRVGFEKRFDLPDEGLVELVRLCELAKTQDVYLVCQCRTGSRCHREFLLLLAKRCLGASAETPKNRYPGFVKRLPTFRARVRKLNKRIA